MSTRPDRYVVIGQPVAHSRSPAIHAAFAEQTGQRIDYARLAAPRDGFAAAARAFFAGGGAGANVTLPFKAEAAALAERLSPRAAAAGAVNTLTRGDDGALAGDNTDGVGLIRDLCANFGVSLAGARVLLLGAGGAARGALGALIDAHPVRLVVANRTPAKAHALAAPVRSRRVEACALTDLETPFDVIVNTISAGLAGEMPALTGAIVHADTAAYDMVYADTATPFMRWAEARGAGRWRDGFGMLVEQAAESFYIWRGVRPPTQPVITALRPRVLA